MKNSLLLVRLPTFAFFVFAIAITGCAFKIVKAFTPEDIQQLEDAKSLFESQMKDDMHPVIWAYLDEILHDGRRNTDILHLIPFVCNGLNIICQTTALRNRMRRKSMLLAVKPERNTSKFSFLRIVY